MERPKGKKQKVSEMVVMVSSNDDSEKTMQIDSSKSSTDEETEKKDYPEDDNNFGRYSDYIIIYDDQETTQIVNSESSIDEEKESNNYSESDNGDGSRIAKESECDGNFSRRSDNETEVDNEIITITDSSDDDDDDDDDDIGTNQPSTSTKNNDKEEADVNILTKLIRNALNNTSTEVSTQHQHTVEILPHQFESMIMEKIEEIKATESNNLMGNDVSMKKTVEKWRKKFDKLNTRYHHLREELKTLSDATKLNNSDHRRKT